MRVYLKLCIILLGVLNSTAVCKAQSSWMERLDESLRKRDVYEKEKQDRIGEDRKKVAAALTDEDRYEALYALFDDYKSYCYDSAVAYAQQCKVLAFRMNDRERIDRSRLALVFCLASGGLLNEAYSQLDSIQYATLPPTLRHDYFERSVLLWRSMADFAHDVTYYQKYITKAMAFQDSLIRITPEKSSKWYKYRGSMFMRIHKHKEALECFNNMLAMPDVTKHERAMACAEMAWAYLALNDEKKAIDAFAESAICDNETATREITALYHLSRLVYKQGDHERASHYVHQALEDVSFYNARVRKVEISEILPIIEQGRYEALQRERNWLMAAGCLFVGLLAVILISYFAIRKRNRKLVEAHSLIDAQVKQLEVSNGQLADANTQLKDMNDHLEEVNMQLKTLNQQLTEADKIKTAYIGRSFYSNAEFIAKLEKTYQAIDRKITTRQYDDLRYTLRQSALNTEREGMYASFDATFLKLFPHFVERYNALFAEEDRKLPPDDESLTNEMRIFALIRLGITDSERIANFLNYSVHTVNTYKTRIKNRSIAENEQFERLIMEI